jgi:general secretion pathway protein A
MSTFDTATHKAIQVVLVGQPELRQYIANCKNLAALRQRIVLAKHLRPLSGEDVARYIEHRLAIASADRAAIGVRFDRAAFNRIHQVTRGIPRLINVVCDNALLLGFVNETRMIGSAIVNRVIEDLVPNFGSDSDSGVENPAMQLGLAA